MEADENSQVDIVNEQVDEEESSIENVKFNFPASVLWKIYFTIDKKTKTMTCKVCTKSFPFKTSAKTSAGNQHLSSKKHREQVLSNIPACIDANYWTERFLNDGECDKTRSVLVKMVKIFN